MFKVLTSLPKSPGCCFICSSSDRKRFIDTNKDNDWDGAVYICELCVAEWARMIGMISPEQAEALIQENIDLTEKLLFAERKIAALEKAVQGVTEYRNLVGDAGNDGGIVFAPDSDFVEAVDGPAQSDGNGEGNVVQGAFGSAEPGAVKQSGDVSGAEPSDSSFSLDL